MKLILLFFTFCSALTAQEKPNILWITSEDNSSHWLGCYGNKQAQTPNLDALAREGVLFEYAYSNAPVCAVARATILMGAYSPTMGTQHMRSRHSVPERFRPNPEYMREAGYHCTNPGKTDYNFKGNDKSYWDKGSYKNRPKDKPFYAILNFTSSHESSLFSKGAAEPKRLKPEEIDLPPYLPDLPAVRKDYARYHDRITQMDAQVGQVLADLEKAGLADDTIVFYYADHGGVLPRGKRYLEETGVKVPLIVRVPEKFKDLSPFKPGQRVEEPVSFVDLAPTILSLSGINIPEQMSGRPFLGENREEPADDEMEFLFADRFDELYGMRRGLTDGKWKYIRNFNPHLPLAPYSFYQFGQPGWVAYQKAYEEGRLTGIHKALWEPPAVSEQLYDLAKDPWEINNLATDPVHSEKLKALRQKLKDNMAEIRDTGLVPEPMFDRLSDGSTIAGYVQSSEFEFNAILDLAFQASSMDKADLPALKKAASAADPVKRYWAATGMLALREKATSGTEALKTLIEDPVPVVRTVAGETLYVLGEKDVATETLIKHVTSEMSAPSLLHLLNTLRRLELLEKLPNDWAKGLDMKGGDYNYIQRFSKRTKE